MFGDINEVRLLGNISNDPMLRVTATGTAVLNFPVATNRNYKKDNEWVTDTDFTDVTVWGGYAESLAKRIKKGTRLWLTGRISHSSYENKNGEKRTKTEIVASKVILVDRYVKTEKEDKFEEAEF